MSKGKNLGITVGIPVGAALLVLGGVVAFIVAGAVSAGDAQPTGMPGHRGGEIAPYAAPMVGLEEAVEQTEEHVREEMHCDFAHFIGQPVDEDALRATGREYRILPPGSMYTMDFLEGRINVHTDDHGVVVRVDCG